MNSKNKKNLIISLGILSFFSCLMLFGLKQNSSFTPSALVGKQTPDFEADVYPLGKFISKNIVNNKTWTVLNFWSSTCYVCKLEAWELQNFYENVSQLNDESPKFVSINIQETLETVGDWQKKYKQTFPVVLDKDGHISILFGVTGTPETFLIDPKGIVKYRIAGEINTNYILDFIKWFDNNPNASEKEAQKFLETA